MKKLISVVTALLLAGCVAPKKKLSLQSADFVGTYTAEYVVDTVEELALQSDGKFTFHFWLIGAKTLGMTVGGNCATE